YQADRAARPRRARLARSAAARTPTVEEPAFPENVIQDIEEGVRDFVDQLPDPTNPDTWPTPCPNGPPLPPMPIPVVP
ncbi:MAG: hypothetical protein ACRD0U_19100, partial [Acidimicrobiales bacterium]